VLSVDDDPVNQLVAGTALRSHNWEVVKSMSGAEVSMSVADVSMSGAEVSRWTGSCLSPAHCYNMIVT